MDLTSKHCVPCEGGIPKMTSDQVKAAAQALDGWTASDDRIQKTFRFRDFLAAMRFVNLMADLAEREGHHPDFCVHYSTVEVTTFTHAVEGLSENDFILAAKIDRLPKDLATAS